jgi:hypothetical protein
MRNWLVWAVVVGVILLLALVLGAAAGEPGPNDTGGTRLIYPEDVTVAEHEGKVIELAAPKAKSLPESSPHSFFDNVCDPFHPWYDPNHHTCEQDEAAGPTPVEPSGPEQPEQSEPQPEQPEQPEPLPPPTPIVPPPMMGPGD